MTKATPLTLFVLLALGATMFWFQGFLPGPLDEWFATLGLFLFAAGLLYGLFIIPQVIASLWSSRLRQQYGIVVPLIVLLMTSGTWLVIVESAVRIHHSMQLRDALEAEQSGELPDENGDASPVTHIQHDVPEQQHIAAPITPPTARLP